MRQGYVFTGGGVCMAGGACMAGACMVGGVGGGGACVAGEMATAADGMHPTGIHSCSLSKYSFTGA